MIQNAKRVPQAFHDILDEWEETADHYFLTGKAGTGKSTLLRLFRQTTAKNVAVLAPTGMAALQVEGQTIHSFFRFPPRLLTPDQVEKPKNAKLLKSLNTLVIDEVSMVRADMLDAIDRSLQLARKSSEPFGGVQMIFFGDVFQLPPVVANREEAAWLKMHYDSPYFFDAHCMQKALVLMITLVEVYRQKEQHFINLLDAIRSGEADDEVLEKLNQRVGRTLPPDRLTVTLCSLNVHADAINRKRMGELSGAPSVYMAQTTGTINPRQIPAESVLSLKEEAQVMFVKNDPQQRYVNGTLGVVKGFTDKGVLVLPEGRTGEASQVLVEPALWEMIRYRVHPGDSPRIEHEVVGSFSQIPIKPAWAITIHKSQGQSYDRVIIDLGGGAFEFGQTYVALSRCRSLEGISLTRPLRHRDIMVDPRITEFFESNRWR
jgi:ATP-dependent DNA helicase PIF1